MPRENAINPFHRRHPAWRRLPRGLSLLALGIFLAGALLPAAALAKEPAAATPPAGEKEKKKEKKSETPLEKPPVNAPVLVVDAVTAPLAGPPGSKVIMTLNIDCGSIENARVVDNLMPRVYNAVIIELNREPLGKDGRIFDQDLDGLKRRLVYQINRALQGPQVVGVYVRSIQEVPLRPPPRS